MIVSKYVPDGGASFRFLRGVLPCGLLVLTASCSSLESDAANVARWSPVVPDEWQEPKKAANPASPRIVLPDAASSVVADEPDIDLSDVEYPERQDVRRRRVFAGDRDLAVLPEVPHSYFYVGGSHARTEGGDSASTLQRELNRRTPGRNTTVQFDDSDEGFKGYVGYRFAKPFALELAYTGLEGSESMIDAPASDPMLVEDVKELHPVTGAGPSASLLGIPYDDGQWSLFTKIGVWYWESDVDVNLNGTKVERKTDDWDAILGVGLQCHVTSGVSIRAEFERYLLRDTDVDVLSIGLNVRF